MTDEYRIFYGFSGLPFKVHTSCGEVFPAIGYDKCPKCHSVKRTEESKKYF